MSKIVFTTWGSLGDLHPYLAIALELRIRGHEVVVATSPCYQQKVQALGLGYHAVRPDCDWLLDRERVRHLSHPRWGLLRVVRELLMPALPEAYEDTLAASQGADLLVAMMATYATRLVAEKRAIPWVSALHIPLGFYSAYDPPVLDVAPELSSALHRCGPAFWKPLLWSSKIASRFVARPWYRQRAEAGLWPATDGSPLVDSHSPLLVLALFSRLLAEKQPDWPSQTVVTGFPFFDQGDPRGLPASLTRFLDEGPAPIVFTLGSVVGGSATSFFEHSIACAKRLNRRAVCVTGGCQCGSLPRLSNDAMVVDYAPFVRLFPRAAAVVHHGGVGTTGEAMRSGRPMLVVPHAWDQPDNARRAARLGIARVVPRHRYVPELAAKSLQAMLELPSYTRDAARVAEQLGEENGVRSAADALERVLQSQAA